jgi:CHAT domain-containing protein/tetratricopeptide (TPR) repeat protein
MKRDGPHAALMWGAPVIVVFLLVGCGHDSTIETTASSRHPASAVSTLQNPATSGSETRAHRLAQQALSLIDQGQYATALPLAQEAVMLNERAFGDTDLEVAQSLTLQGLAFHYLAKVPEAMASHERALRIREQHLGKVHPLVADSLTGLARAVISAGDFHRAQGLLERALQIRERTVGATHPDMAVTLTYLGMVRGLSMDLPGAIRDEARAVTIFEQAPEANPTHYSMALNSLGTITGRTGDFSKARPLIERALRVQEDAFSASHPLVARTLDSLSDLIAKMGAPDEALPFAERALQIREKTYGASHVEVAASLNTVGRLQWSRRNFAQAVSLFERALRIIERAVGPNHPVVAANLLDLGEVRRQQGELQQARTLFERAIQIQEQSLGASHPDLATSLTRLGSVFAQSNDVPKAIALLSRATSIREQTLGPQHPDLAASLNDLARLHHANGEFTKARPLYERARQIYLSMGQLNEDLDDTTLGQVAKRGVAGLQAYLLLLAMQSTSPLEPERRSAASDGFLVAEQARGWIVQAAVAKAMARRQAGGAEELHVAQQVEELRRRRQTLRVSLTTVYGQASDPTQDTERGVLQEQLLQVQRDLDRHVKQLEAAFPRYASMALPRPVEAGAIQQFLQPGEAMVTFYTLDDRVQIWLLKKGEELIYRETIVSRSRLLALVERLRKSLVPLQSTTLLPPVDVETAFELHRLLFQPIRSVLTDVQALIVVPDELLLPLPLSVLLTERSKDHASLAELYRQGWSIPFDEVAQYPYASLPWLGKSYALSILPSAGVLKLLRETVPPRDERSELFIGFADPLFQGQGTARGTAMMANRGGAVDLDRLRQLNRLPGTKEEVLAMARVFGVNPDTHVYLEQRATEAEVKRLSQSGKLGQAQVIAFSTHGLLAGELMGLSQPALALTMPEHPTAEDDGLLTLEEVLQLKLPQTELVVLSACNTAGGDGSGEALSGLARAFFFAGAKALLVSYWSVDDAATQLLMTKTFTRYAHDRRMSPANAVRQGMLDVMVQPMNSTQKYFGHPYAWAAFFLVGEGTQRVTH